MPRKTSEEITDSERYNKKLPDRLRDLFRKTNATQDQLAEKLGVKRQSISYYCDGSSKPDWERLGIIAEFFGVSSDYLIGITDDPKPKSSVIDDLGLPISVCDMLLEHNKAESLQRRGLEALCETGAFFDLCEKIGILCEAAKPYKPEFPAKSDPQNFRRILDREDKQEEEKRHLVEKGRLNSMNSQIEETMKDFPDLQKHGQFVYGQEFTDLLKYQVSQLMEKAMETIMLNAREE